MKKWIQAARLRTLPLSMSGILLAAFIAKYRGFFQLDIFVLSLLTTLAFQILSNFANDYGDGVKGTDANRTGELRAVQAGLITAKQMKNAVILMIVISLILVFALLYVSFLPSFSNYFWVYIGLGVASILAAIGYTMGKKPYGYFAMGDIFVFIFFGIVSVAAGEFLYSKLWDWYVLLPAASMGFWSVAVLNLNNMRDAENDKLNNKRTIALLLGFKKAKYYQIGLMTLPFICALIYVLIHFQEQIGPLIFLVLLIPATGIRRQILKVKDAKDYDQYLKPVALLALLFAVVLGFGFFGFNNLNALIQHQ